MANELKIRVVFDTGQAKANVDALTQSYTQFAGRVSSVVPAINQATTATHGVAKGSANAAMTLQALNYTVRDSPYFFRDFSLGVLAVGNNLNPLIDGLKRMNDEAKASNMTFMQMATKTMGSGGWFTLGMSLAVTAIQAVTFMLAKNKGEVKATTDELKNLLSAYQNYTNEVAQRQIDMKRLELAQMDKYP